MDRKKNKIAKWSKIVKTMLLSFKPEWFEKIKDGRKIFEYRNSFANDEVMAYMYVSHPLKQIVGKIHLGKRIDINEWKNTYSNQPEVMARIEDYLSRHKYAMPILSFQMTNVITLEELRKFNKSFVCPQMYYYLDNYPELFAYVKEGAYNIGELIEHDFSQINVDDICRKVY